jgi:hypothetical protein
MKKGFLGRILPKGWKRKGAPKGNSRAVGRKQGLAFSTRFEREHDAPPPMQLDGPRDYLHANCVVLAAAVFARPWAKMWAMDLLPTARILDARRLEK